MNSQVSQSASYQSLGLMARIGSALAGSVVGIGMLAVLVTGMGEQSGGQSLGDFVLARSAAQHAQVAAVAVAGNAI